MAACSAMLPLAAAGSEDEAPPLSAAALAERFLSPQAAATIVDYRLSDPAVAGRAPSGAVLFSRAVPAAPGICRRTRYYVPLAQGALPPPAAGPLPVVRYAALAAREDCAAAPAGSFAQVQPQTADTDAAVAALGAVMTAQRQVRAGAASAPRLSCASGDEGGPCNARAALAELPLDQLFIITRLDTDRWRFTIRTQMPGQSIDQAVWQADLTEQEGVPVALDLARIVPAPF